MNLLKTLLHISQDEDRKILQDAFNIIQNNRKAWHKKKKSFYWSELIIEYLKKLNFGKFNNDSLSPVAPFRILNIGNTKKVFLLDFIKQIEKELGKKAIRNYMPLQKGDVKQTLSNTDLLNKITGYNPTTNYKLGIKKFLKWYKDYYK